MTSDRKSSKAAALVPIARGIARFVLSTGPKRPFLQRYFTEVKVAAGRIPPIGVSEIPGIDAAILGTAGLLASIAKAIGARRVFEFGTFLGATSIGVARLCPSLTVTTLDVPQELELDFGQLEEGSGIAISDPHLFTRGSKRGSLIVGPGSERVTQLREDSANFDPSPFAGSFDLVYIDASHTYSAVRSDSEKAFVMLKAHGAILWDDYSYPGVWMYLNELAASSRHLCLRYLYDWNKVLLMPTAPSKLPSLASLPN